MMRGGEVTNDEGEEVTSFHTFHFSLFLGVSGMF